MAVINHQLCGITVRILYLQQNTALAGRTYLT